MHCYTVNFTFYVYIYINLFKIVHTVYVLVVTTRVLPQTRLIEFVTLYMNIVQEFMITHVVA
jgi:hypothetical protein